MISLLLRLTAVLLLLLGALAPQGADAAEALTPEQKRAVERVIHDYFTNHPEFMVEILRAAEAKMKQEKSDEARQVIAEKRAELLNDAAAPVGGNPDGDVTIVEFFDYRCPYCKQVEPSLASLIKSDGKLRIVYKEFPILGPESVVAARMALAAKKQGKYFAFHEAMMARKGKIDDEVIFKTAADAGVDVTQAKSDMNTPEIDAILKRNYKLAEALDIQGTPAFIIGNVMTPGATDIENLRKMIAQARNPG